MNILFLTIGRMNSIREHGIYPDLLRCLQEKGHCIYTVSPYEKRTGKQTELVEDHGTHMLHVATGNVTGGTNLIEKGIATLTLESLFIRGVKKYFPNVKFDLVMYSTPPITFSKIVKYIKKRDGAKTYLLLKDIFPQNAVDLGIMRKSGVKGLLYRYFRLKEKKLYAFSDHIGCMSLANVDYVVKHNSEIDPSKVEVCPNCAEFRDLRVETAVRNDMRTKYDLPLDKKIFIYGGNLGKPQGVNHLVACLRTQKEKDDRFFLVVGSGAQFGVLERFAAEEQPNFKLLSYLPKEDYDRLVAACDVGMIFLDHRFTIPNFPSRLLPYMQAGLPVLCCTDPNTDIGKVCEEGGFGWWCESDDPKNFAAVADRICTEDDVASMCEKATEYMKTHYTANVACDIIMNHF